MRRAIVVAGLALACVQPAWAQRVHGRLLDMETRLPLDGGLVTLRTARGERIGSVAAVRDGTFSISVPGAGFYYVEVNRLGYRLLRDGPFELEPGGDREVVYSLQRMAYQLAPIEVNAAAPKTRSAYLQQVGFYERQKSDFGHYITRDEIEARQPHRFTDILRVIPGVRILPSQTGGSGSTIQLRGSMIGAGTVCHPQIIIDGLVVIRGTSRPWSRAAQTTNDQATEQAVPALDPDREQVTVDDVVMPDDVEAVEVFRSGVQVPVRFGGMSTASQCGAIVIWTRRGHRDS